MVKNILTDYISFVKDFETLIRKQYKLSDDQRVMPGMDSPYGKKGEIENYTYWFHGSGCSLEADGIECHYDYYIHDITFTLWSFKQFIITHPRYKNELLLTDQYLELELYKLVESKQLFWKIDGGVVWQVYHYKD
ncbi:DUF6896 domain-containing protein [Chryseobacterium daecheongense]|uniref:DUF6896 domain-containing protein n=1 Tax=Chryseobacterium daecheongense TaxID=192389 RepID=A0A3N0VSP5_9FLAO|nr:hypothetical protein EGI05_15010 [Chryseobacterium daecheongense]TDX91779.1 hypothetical protein BCF50_2917 [Chryseobacterium daecheongense]